MASTDHIITEHINQAQDCLTYSRQQLRSATEEDRPAWKLQIQADEAALHALIRFMWDATPSADPVALAEQRREELRTATEAADPDAMHHAYERGVAGGVAHHATFMRALAPFTALANLHSALWKASRTAA